MGSSLLRRVFGRFNIDPGGEFPQNSIRLGREDRQSAAAAAMGVAPPDRQTAWVPWYLRLIPPPSAIGVVGSADPG